MAYFTYNQPVPWTMRAMEVLATLYLRASERIEAPSLCAARIAQTSSAVSFARPCRSPVGWRARPLFSMSRTLSPCVPLNRCSTLTQKPLSHVWQMVASPGSSLLNRNHAARCASHCRPTTLQMPYRLCEPMAPVQMRHPDGSGRVRAKKRALAVSMFSRLCRPQTFLLMSYNVPQRLIESNNSEAGR